MNWQEFLAMGGYAAFVWPSYALAVIVLVANVVAPHVRERRLLRTIARRAATGDEA
ncbi:MAG: heme exporter protein CcmD [Halofilum sp. (in: g-proteobacteria)]|nr:heme exporter protein CcmD [Halofilum sp. (in: g-proteobacteria)]